MKRLIKVVAPFWAGFSIAGTAVALAAAQPAERPKTSEVIARVHSVGLSQAPDPANGRVFREVWSLPISARLREEASLKVASALAKRFQGKNNQAAVDAARLLQPLVHDLTEAEMHLEVTEHPGDTVEAVVAVRLDDSYARVWQKNWTELTTAWSLAGDERVDSAWTNGWFAVRWLSGGKAGAAPPVLNGLIARLQRGERPVNARGDSWLSAQLNLARCLFRLSGKHDKNLPLMDLTLGGRKEYVRTEAKLTFANPAVSRVEKWEIPVETIRDPLISFTAMQGIGEWLKKTRLIKDLGLDRAPNQLYVWGLSQTAFQIQAAVPVQDPVGLFNRVAETGVPRYNKTLSDYAVGNITRLTDRPELIWKGLPLLVPYLSPVTEQGRGYLHGGIFPVNPSTNPPPMQLFQQLTSQTNLLYYDWEITQARLAQLRPLLQLGAVFLTVSPMSTNSNASQWLDAIEPRVGNTVTEIKLASAREMQVVRTSHLGLNGLELLALANWLEGTNFPRLNLDLNFRPIVTSTRQKRTQ